VTLRIPNPFRREAPEPLAIEVAGRRVPVELNTNPRARRITLRADATRGTIRLTVPPRGSAARALAMLDTHRGWIEARVAAWPAAAAFAPGGRLSVEGVELVIDWSSDRPRTASIVGTSLRIGGPRDGLAARVERFLKRRARAVLAAETREHALRLGRPVAAVSVRDTASRWGSCTAGGRIAYSWRLILAPPAVRRYVVAHEVAHLAHLDHGADFWRVTAELYDGDVAAARRWLKRHGAALHWVGRG
jgi:predicted metal-dependent hydrolase